MSATPHHVIFGTGAIGVAVLASYRQPQLSPSGTTLKSAGTRLPA
jgi:hypothetical protein